LSLKERTVTMSSTYTITNNKQNMRFEIPENDRLAFLEYRLHDGTIAFMHTEVPEAFAGRGAASALAVYAFNYAKENNLPVKVYCSFVAKFVKKHPEYQSQIVPKPEHN
ncbi:MAG: GNAT family N-acetyltransferase, partial [Bacteroidota bacterium]